MSRLLGFDVFAITKVCKTCGEQFHPGYAHATRIYCSPHCSRHDPSTEEKRHQTQLKAAKAAAEKRTANARIQLCLVCGVKLKVADHRTMTCGTKLCRSEMRARKALLYTPTDNMPKRRAGRKDYNHNGLVVALEKSGCSVIDMSSHGGGFPDLIVWSRGTTYLVEIKNPENSYGRKGANKNQITWAQSWPSPVWIIATLDDVEHFINGRFKNLKWYGRPRNTDDAIRAICGDKVTE